MLVPLLFEEVGAGETTVATDDDESIDAQLHEVLGGPTTAFPGAELHAASSAEHGAALMQDAAHGFRGRPLDLVATLNQSLKPLVDRIHSEIGIQPGTNHRPHGGIHSRGVTTTRKHSETLWTLWRSQHFDLLQTGRSVVRSPAALSAAMAGFESALIVGGFAGECNSEFLLTELLLYPYRTVWYVIAMNQAETTRRGRPRDPAVDQAILDAARSVVAEKGFNGASMDEIARRAGVGKDTLYRRWKSKEELVLHLLTLMSEQNVPAPQLEDPRYGLFVFLQNIRKVNLATDAGSIIASIVSASNRNERLAEVFQQFWRERRKIAATPIREIVPSSTTDEEIEIILDHILGPIYYRLLLTGDPIDDEYLWELISTIPWSPEEQLEQT